MIAIILGHLIGLGIPFLFFDGVPPVVASESGEKLPVFAGIFFLVGFLEYQMYRSLTGKTVYFRGQIDKKSDSSTFLSIQFFYSLLSGFLLVVFFRALAS